jgi:hypothetical protein
MGTGRAEEAAQAIEELSEKLGVQMGELKEHLGALGGSLKHKLESAVQKARTEAKEIEVEGPGESD